MQTRMFDRQNRPMHRSCSADFTPLNDLLHMMSTGKTLTPHEKIRVQRFANEQRKKNLAKRNSA